MVTQAKGYMNINEKPATPRVARVEVHYEDGSKDVMTPGTGDHAEMSLYIWSRKSATVNFNRHAYSTPAVAAVLYRTIITKQWVHPNPRDMTVIALLDAFRQERSNMESSKTPPPSSPG